MHETILTALHWAGIFVLYVVAIFMITSFCGFNDDE